MRDVSGDRGDRLGLGNILANLLEVLCLDTGKPQSLGGLRFSSYSLI